MIMHDAEVGYIIKFNGIVAMAYLGPKKGYKLCDFCPYYSWCGNLFDCSLPGALEFRPL